MKCFGILTEKCVAQTLTWLRRHCKEILEKPKSCYKYIYALVSDPYGVTIYFLVANLLAFGIWGILAGVLQAGFTFPSSDYGLAVFVLIFMPTWFIALFLSNYWTILDLWYRQLQPYMGLRQPSPAKENLLLGYTCDLPVVISIKAFGAGHWRLALTSTMALVQRVFQVLVGSLLTIDTTTSASSFHIIFAATQFKAILGLLASHLIIIPFLWPGLDRRLPIMPRRIADQIVLFYDSTLVQSETFLPRRTDEERWHMEYRLCLEERLYAFGIYAGINGALHLGMDDAFTSKDGDKEIRTVAPVKPPKRLYRRWLGRARDLVLRTLGIDRQPVLTREEQDALERLDPCLQEPGEEQDHERHDHEDVVSAVAARAPSDRGTSR